MMVGLLSMATVLLIKSGPGATVQAFAPSRVAAAETRLSPSSTQLGIFPIVNFPLNNGKAPRQNQRILYIIEQLGERPKKQMFNEIADMCIEVFFNEDVPSKGTPFKDFHLSYLRRLQSDDLRVRRAMRRSERCNAMFVARRAVPLSSPSAPTSTPLILDTTSIYNLSPRWFDEDYVKGDVLGFCEVSRKPYGLPQSEERQLLNGSDGDVPLRRKVGGKNRSMYPVLTNLAVAPEARNSGVGSELLKACEQVIQTWNPPSSELLLEVEDDNESALGWYQKRGYRAIFADPASRRYDANGWLLQKVRCTKICMRKNVRACVLPGRGDEQVTVGLGMFSSRVLQSLRDSVFHQQ